MKKRATSGRCATTSDAESSGGGSLSLPEEVVSSLELAVANLDRCLEGLKHDTVHKEVMRGTMEVVQAATRLVACIKKEQNSKS